MSLYYKYTTLNLANNLCNNVNTGEGIPVSQNATTKTYCSPIEESGSFYVISDEITSKYTSKTPVEMPVIPPPTI